MGNTFYFDWEVSFMIWFQKFLGSFGISMAKTLTILGEPVILVIAFAIVYWGFSKKFGKQIVLALLTTTLFNCMLKNIVLRRRPFFDHKEIKCFKKVADENTLYSIEAQGFSFPSAHSMNVYVLMTTIAKYLKQNWLKLSCYIMIILVGLSRIELGVHYPTDVISGFILAAGIMYILPIMHEKYSTNTIYIFLVICGLIGCVYCRTEDFYTTFGLLCGFAAGDLFEQRYVNFQETKSVKTIILRVLLGLCCIVVLYTLLQLPIQYGLFSTSNSNLYRIVRYAIITFVVSGLYPLTFKKILKK